MTIERVIVSKGYRARNQSLKTLKVHIEGLEKKRGFECQWGHGEFPPVKTAIIAESMSSAKRKKR